MEWNACAVVRDRLFGGSAPARLAWTVGSAVDSRLLVRVRGDRFLGVGSVRDDHAARQPGARPPCGGWIDSASIPLRAITHAITAFEFHISPV
jgi:hypothetical protein